MAEAVLFYSVPRSVLWTVFLPRQQDLCLDMRLQVNWSHSVCVLLHSCVWWLFCFLNCSFKKVGCCSAGTSTLLVSGVARKLLVLVIKVGLRVGNQFAVLRQTFVGIHIVETTESQRSSLQVCSSGPGTRYSLFDVQLQTYFTIFCLFVYKIVYRTLGQNIDKVWLAKKVCRSHLEMLASNYPKSKRRKLNSLVKPFCQLQ